MRTGWIDYERSTQVRPEQDEDTLEFFRSALPVGDKQGIEEWDGYPTAVKIRSIRRQEKSAHLRINEQGIDGTQLIPGVSSDTVGANEKAIGGNRSNAQTAFGTPFPDTLYNRRFAITEDKSSGNRPSPRT